MKNNINISVIIPTYNRGSTTLMKAIQSALNQTFRPIEILVCDDGSTDGTYDQIKNLHNPLVKYIFCGRHGRPSVPRNIGIKKSVGNWIAFLDSDDFWFKDKLQKQVEYLKDKNINMLCSNAMVNNSEEPLILNSKNEITKENLIKKNDVINSSVLIKKEILIKCNYFPESRLFKAIEDYLLWFKYTFISKIIFINEPLLSYNQMSELKISAKSNLIKIFQFLFIYFYFIFYSLKMKDYKILIKIFNIMVIKINNNFKKYLFRIRR